MFSARKMSSLFIVVFDENGTSSIFNGLVSTRKGICRTGRVRDVHSRCVRLCERVFTTL